MCKKCGHDPYLAGSVVLFTFPFPHPVRTDDDKIVTVVDVQGPYTGVCVRHHRGWVTVRTRQRQFVFKPEEVEEHIIATIEKGAKVEC